MSGVIEGTWTMAAAASRGRDLLNVRIPEELRERFLIALDKRRADDADPLDINLSEEVRRLIRDYVELEENDEEFGAAAMRVRYARRVAVAEKRHLERLDAKLEQEELRLAERRKQVAARLNRDPRSRAAS